MMRRTDEPGSVQASEVGKAATMEELHQNRDTMSQIGAPDP